MTICVFCLVPYAHDQAAAAHANTTAKMVVDRVSHKTKIDVFENAFRKIKEVRYAKTKNKGNGRRAILPRAGRPSPKPDGAILSNAPFIFRSSWYTVTIRESASN